MIRTLTVKLTPVGGAGAAAASGDTPYPISGQLMGTFVDYSGQGVTTDLTVATKNAPAKTLLTLTNINTDAWYYPRAQAHDTVGAPITGFYTPIPVDDYLTVTVAQGDPAANGAIAYLLIEDNR